MRRGSLTLCYAFFRVLHSLKQLPYYIVDDRDFGNLTL